jgi:hypothetical protein
MNPRRGIMIASVAACLVAVVLVWGQQCQLDGLRQQKRNLASRAPAPAYPPPLADRGAATETAPTTPSEYTPSLELLRLRNKTTQLRSRLSELDGVHGENERLRQQLATAATNAAAKTVLPPGYLLKSAAKFSGYDTPEHSLQTMLWAVRNRDFTNLLMVFTPEAARKLDQQIQQSGKSPEEFLNAMNLPGIRIVGRENKADGTADLKVEVAPGMSAQPTHFHFRLIDGDWKLVLR